MTEARTIHMGHAAAPEWTEDTPTILRAAMARTRLVEDDVAAAWKVAAEYYGADGADHEIEEASRRRILQLAEDYR